MSQTSSISRLANATATLMLLACCLLPANEAAAAPNFVVILVDDAGFMDMGGYGGEADTPNISRLADRGVRFSNYHTSPLCAPSRAMLLTGMDNHRTGVGTIPEVLHRSQSGSSAYALHLLPGVQTIAGRLRQVGYATYMTGKWHLGRSPGQLPDAHGFDRSYALDASGADNWEHRSFMPLYDDAPWFEDGEPVRLPETFYSSEFLVDKMIEYLQSHPDGIPFFSYLSFQAIHIPVQAPREFTDRYEGVYSAGWDVLREKRIARARQLGLMPAEAPSPQAHSSLRPWNSLSPDQQRHYELNMMVNAGMLEAMDYHIGRLVEFLASAGSLEETVFIITSDNGPEFNDPSESTTYRFWMSNNGYHLNPQQAGERGYMGAIGSEWASVAAVPGSLFKMYASEGGTRVPMMISGPGVSEQAGFNAALSFVTDISPTIAELAGLEQSEEMDGRSLVPLLTGQQTQVYRNSDAVGLEVAGNSALYKGRYKLTRSSLPHGDATWRLHDINADPAERIDLSESHPEVRKALMADYRKFADRVGVITLPDDFNVQDQITVNAVAQLLQRNQPATALIGLVALVLIGTVIFLLLRRRSSVKIHEESS